MSWGPEVQLIDSGAECVRDISVLLNYFEINRSRQLEDCHHQFYTTANAASFAAIAKTWLHQVVHVEHVELMNQKIYGIQRCLKLVSS